MPRRPRRDGPGVWHHVMNRAATGRAMFENPAEAVVFLSLVAREVRAGRIAVVAFSILSTHFHLLLVSLRGEISRSLRRIQSRYARRFNLCRDQDGPLVKGRFTSKRVDSEAYRRAVVAYIDRNATAAGVAADPRGHPFGSAAHYARPSGPRWLDRAWVERYVCRLTGASAYTPQGYLDVFLRDTSTSALEWAEVCLGHRSRRPDRTDRFLGYGRARVLRWMRARSRLPDGRDGGVPVVDPGAVRVALRDERALAGTQVVRPFGRPCDAWTILETALLRDLCGLPFPAIACLLGDSVHRVRDRYPRHRALLHSSPSYAAQVGAVVRAALVRCHGALAVDAADRAQRGGDAA